MGKSSIFKFMVKITSIKDNDGFGQFHYYQYNKKTLRTELLRAQGSLYSYIIF